MELWDIFFSHDITISQGAFVGTILHYLNGNRRQKKKLFATVITNYMSAIYITTLVLEQTGSNESRAVAFLIGFFGFRIVERTMDKLFEKFGNTLNDDDNDTGYDSNTDTDLRDDTAL